jgi:hypothetical protein|tara:strand:- start:186 stop:434 length:249 start_codon:yes stop_codon:yes gene_type:complete
MKRKSGKLFVSPDGGETIYEQNKNGTRGKMVSQSQLAKDIELGQNEEEMIGPSAIELRRNNPSLQKAWNQYATIWHLTVENN